MPDEAQNSVLKRMAAGRNDAGLSEMTPIKALRNAVSKAADDILDTVVAVHDIQEDTVLPDELGEGLPDPALFLRLDGPGGAIGIVCACPQVIGAVIESSTMGKILHSEAPNRRPTATDAMLANQFLEATLRGFEQLAESCAKPPPVDGFHCGMLLPDVRGAQMMVGDVRHRRFRMELVFNGDAKTGQLCLIFPAEGAGASSRKAAADWNETLENAVMGTSARMEAHLCKFKLPLHELSALKIGDVVKMEDASLDGLTLIGADGGPVLRARLGRSGPLRAVRLFLDGKTPAAPPATLTEAALPTAMSGGMASGLDPAPLPEAIQPAPLGMEPAAMEPAAMDLGAMEPAPMAMDPAPLEPAAMEPAALEPAAMDLGGIEPVPLAMDPAPMELEPQPLDMPAMAAPLPIS